METKSTIYIPLVPMENNYDDQMFTLIGSNQFYTRPNPTRLIDQQDLDNLLSTIIDEYFLDFDEDESVKVNWKKEGF